MAIELTLQGMCATCPLADLELTKTNTFARGNDWFVTCKHRPACLRVMDKFKDKEVKEGEWLDTEDTYAEPPKRQTCKCSNCGKVSPRPLGDFCRWCGADMRGGADG